MKLGMVPKMEFHLFQQLHGYDLILKAWIVQCLVEIVSVLV